MERTAITITGPDFEVDWTKEPVFDFAREVDALQTLTWLSEDLKAAREQERQVTRYMKAAVRGADAMGEGERPTRQAIINHSGMARQTVYDTLDGEG
jgi:hypothetical protein